MSGEGVKAIITTIIIITPQDHTLPGELIKNCPNNKTKRISSHITSYFLPGAGFGFGFGASVGERAAGFAYLSVHSRAV